MSDLPNLRESRARWAPAKPLCGRHWWPRIVKPIALGWLLTTATAALSQSDGLDHADDLRMAVDEGAERALPDGADLTPPVATTPLYSPGAAPPDGQASDPARTPPSPRLPSLADPATPAAPALPGTTPTPSVPPRRKAAIQDDPFNAPGVRVGTFLLRQAIEVFSGYDSNPARVPGGGGSPLRVVAPELQLQSDWTRHELTAVIRGSYNDYPAIGLADRPALNAAVDGRIDVTRDSRIDLEGRSVLGTDYPGSPNLAADIAKLPIFTTVGGTLGLGQRFGLLDVALKGMIDRSTWQDSRLTDGSTASNDDRNFNQVGAELRAAYALTGALKPFIAFDVDTRRHDLPLDRSGLMRDADGMASRAGADFALS